MERIRLAYDREKLRAVVNTVMDSNFLLCLQTKKLKKSINRS